MPPPFLSESSGLIEPANTSSRAEIDAAMETTPDVEWRLIIALSRYAGLRIPSELLSLRWNDVDLPGGRMTIRSSKTEHHKGGGIRICSLTSQV
jgi:integrase